MKHTEKPVAQGTPPDRPLSSLPRTLTLHFSPGEEEKATRAMEAWVEALAEQGEGKIVCEKTGAKNQPFLPCLSMSSMAGSSIHYHFVPEGPEEPVFREFLWEAAARADSGGAHSTESVHPGPPWEILLFISNHCPNCPRAVRTVQALAGKLPDLSVHFFEAMLHTDLAEKHNIRSVPTLLLGRELRYVGALDEEKLFWILRKEEPQSLLHEKIRQKIQEGSAVEAAAWIAQGGDPSFLAQDLGRSTFQERIALLLTLEEALETDPRCLDRMVAPLLPHLETGDASVRGDIADLLGKIGDPKALPALKRLCKDPDPNVAEAATEAVETIENECG